LACPAPVRTAALTESSFSKSATRAARSVTIERLRRFRGGFSTHSTTTAPSRVTRKRGASGIEPRWAPAADNRFAMVAGTHQVLDSDPVIFRHEGGGDPRTAVARELAGGRSEVNRLSGNSRPRAASACRQGIRGPPRDHVLRQVDILSRPRRGRRPIRRGPAKDRGPPGGPRVPQI